MKVVINVCFGVYSLSPAGVRRLAELKGKKCYFFRNDYSSGKYVLAPLKDEEIENKPSMFFSAFTVPYPPSDAEYHEHYIDTRPEPRNDPDLVRVVEELGDKANGDCAKLRVVEIPDGTDFEIQEYDGNEHIAERHNTWS